MLYDVIFLRRDKKDWDIYCCKSLTESWLPLSGIVILLLRYVMNDDVIGGGGRRIVIECSLKK